MPEMRKPKFDVALSFASEDRPYVQKVAAALKDAGISVFYDNYEQVALWGKDLYTHLDKVYRQESRYCVLFVSEHYAERVWTNHERRSAQARAIRENREYVLPARFDETPIDGLPDTVGYLDISNMRPKEFARLVREKVGSKYSKPGFPRRVDRLWAAMNIPKSDKEGRERVHAIAYSFYNALRKMTPAERSAVAGVLLFGCDAELPGGVHISLDLLSRMLQQSKDELLDNLAAVRSLNVKVKVRESFLDISHGELAPEDKDLLLSYWSRSAPWDDDATTVVTNAVRCASDHFCMDHGVKVVAALDFSRLAKSSLDLLAKDPNDGVD
ncbi:toll/interleukin-1 receptor domain-containing protein [Streptomyces griseoluteus]|nr:TIR domain-containing protein [Streptomyces griseoluteus]GHE92416.1 hypothetical protein GCM10017776_06000 [Streptomyces griseoluteus]